MYNGSGMSAGAGGRGKPWHYFAGISVFFLIMAIAGVVLLPIGTGKAKTNDSYDPALDFEAVEYDTTTGYGCTISSVEHVADQRQNQNPYCVDVYTYTFNYLAGSDDALIYTSGAEEHKRTGPGKCDNDNSKLVVPTYVVGATPTCYMPATSALPISASFTLFYNCGNDDCVKVENPSINWDSANQNADLFIILGGVFTAIGFTGLIIFVFLTIKGYKALSA